MTATAPVFASFPDIELFHNVVRMTEKYPFLVTGPVTYRAKNKLHGTNAAVNVLGGEVAAQSRTTIITTADDNCGFARWVEGTAEFWKTLPDMVVFGEWCGPGINKGTAVQKIPNKVFAVFAILRGDQLVSAPDEIDRLLSGRPEGVYVLPWYGEEVTVDYTVKEDLQGIADRLNGVLAVLEPVDTWVRDTFGVEGIAEGLVYYPVADARKVFSDFAFKVKGEKHQAVKNREPVIVDPEVVASVEAFVAKFATEARLEQGLAAIGGGLETKNVGPFLKWFGQDVQKESADELEVSGLEWSQVQKAVQAAARNWFLARSRAL